MIYSQLRKARLAEKLSQTEALNIYLHDQIIGQLTLLSGELAKKAKDVTARRSRGSPFPSPLNCQLPGSPQSQVLLREDGTGEPFCELLVGNR